MNEYEFMLACQEALNLSIDYISLNPETIERFRKARNMAAENKDKFASNFMEVTYA